MNTLVDWFLWFRYPILLAVIGVADNPNPTVVKLVAADFTITVLLWVFD